MSAERPISKGILGNIHSYRRFAILITTYRRPSLLSRLLKNLRVNSENYLIHYFIYDDKVTRNGKKRFWNTINTLWTEVRMQHFDYYFHLQDDIIPCSDFINRTLSIWHGIKDPKKICLNLFLDRHRAGAKVWSDQKPSIEYFEDLRVLKTQWTDMIFFCEKSFFEKLEWRINPISVERWKRKAPLSSGVGAQISRRLQEMDSSLYLVTDSLVEHFGSESRMNPEVRPKEPLAAWRLPKIYVTITGSYLAKNSLQKFKEGLMKYVDILLMYSDTAEYCKEEERVLQLPRSSGSYVQQFFFNLGTIKVMKEEDFYYLSIKDLKNFEPSHVWNIVRTIEASERLSIIKFDPEAKKIIGIESEKIKTLLNEANDSRLSSFFSTGVCACHSSMPISQILSSGVNQK